MDHSIQTYLQKQSAEHLLDFLRKCQKEHLWNVYSYVIPDILKTFNQRKIDIPPDILQD